MVHIRRSRWLATCRDGKVRMWDAAGTLLGEFRGKYGDIHPDGRCVATVSEEDGLSLWSLGGDLLGSIRGKGRFLRVEFSGGPNVLLTRGNLTQVDGSVVQEAILWDCFLDYR